MSWLLIVGGVACWVAVLVLVLALCRAGRDQ